MSSRSLTTVRKTQQPQWLNFLGFPSSRPFTSPSRVTLQRGACTESLCMNVTRVHSMIPRMSVSAVHAKADLFRGLSDCRIYEVRHSQRSAGPVRWARASESARQTLAVSLLNCHSSIAVLQSAGRWSCSQPFLLRRELPVSRVTTSPAATPGGEPAEGCLSSCLAVTGTLSLGKPEAVL